MEEMMLFVDTHDTGCMLPTHPCRYCKGRAFLEQHLSPEKYQEFLSIIDTETVGPILPIDYATPIRELTLSTRAKIALQNDGLRTFQDIVQYRVKLTTIPHVGEKILAEVNALLKSAGLPPRE